MNTNVTYLKGLRLNKETNFITAQDVISEVRSKMRTYFEQGIVDDGTMYPVIRECLAKLGAKIYPTSTAIVPIDTYKGRLPQDFRKLILAIGCGSFTTTETEQIGSVYEVTETIYPIPCIDECGDSMQIIQKFDTYTVDYNSFFPLSVSFSSYDSCVTDCFNKKKFKDEIHIDYRSKVIHTNFETGHIYIEYVQDLEQEGDLLIPDFAQIREWIKDKCIVEILEEVFFNFPTQDVVTKLNYAKNEAAISEANARSFVRMNEYSEFYDIRRLFSGRYSKFNQMIYGRH